MKLSQQNVFRILEAVGERGATSKEILTTLAQKKKRKAQLRKILKGLLKNKTFRKHNNRYYLVNDTSAVVTEKARRATRSSVINSRKKRSNHFLGQVIYHHRKFVIYSYADAKEYNFLRAGDNGLLHGDVVSFNIRQSKQGEAVADVIELRERRIAGLKGKVHAEKKGRLVFVPNHPVGTREFDVSNKVTLKKGHQVEAWLNIGNSALANRKPAGEVQLISEKSLYDNPMLEDILIQNNIPTHFPKSVQAEAQLFPNAVRVNKKSNREDLRDLPFVTIDGADAKDFDDAIYAEKEGTNHRIWVSIADVASYVLPGSAIEREAFSRGTSTYLPGKAYPMLPEALSNGLCSLKEGVNRKTLTCESLIDKNGKTKTCRIYASINKIKCRLTYSEVDKYYDTKTIKKRKGFQSLSEQLSLYKEIAEILRKRRITSGFVDFHLPETRFLYDKKGIVVDLQKTYQTSAMKVIEQFMLLANENVAKFCDQNKLPIVWRNHPQPLSEKLEHLKKLFWNNKIKLASLSSGKDYNQARELIKQNPKKDFLEYAMLRSMSLAVYETQRRGHFGIASEYYCHFTSPIRRYPDLLVHRALKNCLSGRKPVNIPEYVAATASDREKLSTAAERASHRFFKLYFMADKIGGIYQAKISGMIHSGIFVEISHPYVEGFVSFATIQDDHYEFDEELQSIFGKDLKTKYTIGKRLKVMLTRLDWHNISLEFDWICWEDRV
ncbi:MAG: VacB/RNase II family 3'-5' exoribonuclease [Proteobacteria bacterium]|nr:VacB/RNase II family 3'-5' exoribonuclease [Pseudomonadota bacterium]